MSKTTKPVLFVVTSNNVKGDTGIPTGFNLSEVTHPLEKLEEAGLKIEFASPKGGEAPLDGMEDFENDKVSAAYWQNEAFRNAIANTQKMSEVDTSKYSAIFFAGGHGTMWDFRGNTDIQKAIREIYENGGVISAVCHGPVALVDVKLSDGTYLVSGKNVASFTNGEEEEVQATNIVPFLLADALEANGATHKNTPNWSDTVVTDGRLVTGQNPQSAASLGVELAKVILDK
ncbi:MAG: type 1 glutamine amidotransferase domain-containing protein [Cruoricaptor ignavus]|nr:type 1 glutamine amidotransferase domain-containing protein [Cruoricaptor ignavus]